MTTVFNNSCGLKFNKKVIFLLGFLTIQAPPAIAADGNFSTVNNCGEM